MGRAHVGVTSHVGKRAITRLLRGVPASTEIPFLIESWLRVLHTGFTCYCMWRNLDFPARVTLLHMRPAPDAYHSQTSR